MTTPSSNPFDLPGRYEPPAGIAPEALLGLVEGGLSGADAERLWASLPPDLARGIEGMRRDRALLASLADHAAPEGLAGRILDQVEREALFEQPSAEESRALRAELDEITRSTPVIPPTVRPMRVHPAASRQVRAFPRPLAMAAGFLLVVGGSAVVWFQGVPPLSKQAPVAMETPERPAPVRPEEPRLAANLPETIDPEPTPVTEADVITEPVRVARAETTEPPRPGAPLGAEVAAATGMAPSGPEPMSIERALTLARQGRLAIHIEAREPAQVRGRLAAMADEGRSSRGWRVIGRADEATARLATASLPTSSELETRRREALAAAFAVADATPAIATFAGNTAGAGSSRFDPRSEGGVFSLESALDPRTLELVSTLLKDRTGGSVRFVELGEAQRPSAPDLRVERVMWWTQPASGWSLKATIPVVVVER